MQYKRWFMLFLSSEPIYRSLLASTWKIHWDSRALDHQYITLSSQSSTNVRGGPFSSIEFGIIFVFAIRALKVHECWYNGFSFAGYPVDRSQLNVPCVADCITDGKATVCLVSIVPSVRSWNSFSRCRGHARVFQHSAIF